MRKLKVDKYEVATGEYRDYEKSHPRYRSEWRKVRRIVLERDNYMCMNCGKTQEELLRNPTGSKADDYLNICHVEEKEDIQPKALITSCRSCHKILDKMWSKGLPIQVQIFIDDHAYVIHAKRNSHARVRYNIFYHRAPVRRCEGV